MKGEELMEELSARSVTAYQDDQRGPVAQWEASQARLDRLSDAIAALIDAGVGHPRCAGRYTCLNCSEIEEARLRCEAELKEGR